MLEDITPLNLEDQPKLFGLRYDQLIVVLISLLVGAQIYSWLNPIPFLGQDLRMMVTVFIMLIGPVYCVATFNGGFQGFEPLIESWFSSRVLIPGADPHPVRFLSDEKLVDFTE